jgi:hypothetical protein
MLPSALLLPGGSFESKMSSVPMSYGFWGEI